MKSRELFTDGYRGRSGYYLQVITTQTIALNNERNGVDILRRRKDASVLLLKALGGGLERFESALAARQVFLMTTMKQRLQGVRSKAR